jgi:hypothetical protein
MTVDLYKQIETDMKSALKEGAAEKLSVLRMLISAVRMQEIDKNIKSLQEPDVLQILQRQIKQRRESIEQFTSGNRPDLAAKEERELEILKAYMPEQLGELEVEALVKAAITELGATTKTDMGKVMKAVMEKAMGKCDGKTINQFVVKYLK